ncbi:hypothetical protein BGZ75_004952 [Mortierella antarctica]|nr:hypothetical protein BGZ75_004952 [Mortierella antarctica]
MPGGILYTGGRDGMIAAWDLHFEAPVPRDIPGESPERPQGLPPSTFRQSFNHHTDWVNDIVLCHNGESLVSASSDRTVKLVRPHSHNPTTAHVIGTHGDYVKTLAYASGPGWLASGGLDKTVHLWDIKEGRSGQFESLGSIPETSSKASIYALACNPSGTVLATGSPEKILSASSDTTIKLWSLTAQRCITTFTMHSDSVWSLYSDHPQLATFYGGGKDGFVTKTEINRYSPEHHNDYDDEDPGQCVVICKAETGVARLVAHDNARIWTATSSSSVFQWPDIPTRVNRSAEMVDSIIPANLLKMNLNESTFMDPIPEQYYPTSTVYSAASLGSIYVHSRDKQSQHSSEDDDGLITPIFEQPENVIQGEHGLIKHTLLNNRRMVVTEDKCGEVALWDLIQCVQLETYTGRKLEDVVNELNTIESVPTWCTIDTRIGALTVHLDEGRCFDAEVYVDEIEETPDPERPEDQRIIIGKWVLKNLFERYVPVHIDAYEKEAYRQEHQDDLPQAAVPMTVVTNERNEVVDGAAVVQDRNDTGARATSDHGSRPTVNTSPEGLRGPAASNGENSATPRSESSSKLTSASTIPTEPNSAATQQPSNVPTSSPRQGPVSTAATPTLTRPSNLFTGSSLSATASPTVPSTPLSPASTSSNGFMGRLKHSVKKLARTPSAEHRFENGKPSGSKKNLPSVPANINVPSGSALSSIQKSLNSPSLLPPDSATLSSFQGTATSAATGTTTVGTETATNSTASSLRTTFVDGAGSVNGVSTGIGGGLGLGLTSNGRLDHDDQHSTSDATSSHSSIDSAPSPLSAPSPVPQLLSSTISVRPPHPPFAPPTHLDCPTVAIPAHIPVIISEQSREASSSVDLYRGSVGALDKDYIPLVQVIPTWLLEVLLKNMVPVKEAAKVSFVLRPHHDQEAAASSEDGPGRLGELPGGNPRLTAPRMLRVRKVIAHVAEKLALNPPRAFAEAAAAAASLVAKTPMLVETTGPSSTIPTTGTTGTASEAQAKAAAGAGQEDGSPTHSSSSSSSSDHHGSRVPLEPVQEDGAEESESTALSSKMDGSATVPPPPPPPPLPSSSAAAATVKTKEQEEEEQEEAYLRQESLLRPEHWMEILCHDQVLPPTMTLATIRSHYWKTGSDVVLTYRYKYGVVPPVAASLSSS